MNNVLFLLFHCSIHVTGHWALPQESAMIHGSDEGSPEVQRLMAQLHPPAAGEKVLYVGFGSMEDVFAGEINWERLVTLLYKGVCVSDAGESC